MKHLKSLAFGLVLLSVTGCESVGNFMGDLSAPLFSSSEDSQADELLSNNCPQVKVVDELSVLNEFSDINRPGPDNLISRVHLAQAESACQYGPKSVTVDLKLAFEGMLGPNGRQGAQDKPFFSYPFFVAVTSPGGDILAKEVFAASMTYEPGRNEKIYYESMRQIIPVADSFAGRRYEVLIGFQLSQDQLQYNRRMIKAAEAQRAEIKTEVVRVNDNNAAAVKTAKEPAPDRPGAPVDIIGQ